MAKVEEKFLIVSIKRVMYVIRGVDLMGLAPKPYSFLFPVKKKGTKKRPDKTTARALCRKAGISNKRSQARLLKFQALRHSKATAPPRFVMANPRCFECKQFVNQVRPTLIASERVCETVRFCI